MSVIGPQKSKNLLYRDELLIMQFRMTNLGFPFMLQNISWNDYRSAGSIPRYSPLKGFRPTSQESFAKAIIIVGGFPGYLRDIMTIEKVPVVE